MRHAQAEHGPANSESKEFYHIKKALQNVAALVDENKQVVERFKYDPHGRTTYLAPDYTSRSASTVDWNLLWQMGHRDPLTGIYLGGDGAYHERLGRSLNPQCGMGQSESDFAANYQKAIDTADPETINLLKPPEPPSLLVRGLITVGGIVFGGLVTVALSPFIGPVFAAIAGGAVAGAFDYAATGLAMGEKLNWQDGLKSTLYGAAFTAGIMAGFKLAALGIQGLAKLATATSRVAVKGGRTLLGRTFASYDDYVPDFSTQLRKDQIEDAIESIVDVLSEKQAGEFANLVARHLSTNRASLRIVDIPSLGAYREGSRIIRLNTNAIHGALLTNDYRRAASIVIHEAQHYFDDIAEKLIKFGRRRGEFRAHARQLDFELRMGLNTSLTNDFYTHGVTGVGDAIVKRYSQRYPGF